MFPRTALVTGASSGIGLELARCMARDGHRLVLVAHDPVRLASAAGEVRAEGAAEVQTLSIDLRAAGAGTALFEQAVKLAPTPDLLVLNAGTGAWGAFVGETDLSLELDSIHVNVRSTVEAAKRFLPAMVARGSGRVLITSSLVAYGPSPNLAVYSATKAFLYAFAEAVREEIAATGVTVTALMPDLTRSRFFERAGVSPDSLTWNQPKADPAIVAREGYDAMLKGSDHVVAPAPSRLKAAVANLLPARLLTKITPAV